MNEPLPYKELNLLPHQKRALFFDPTEVYSRISFNPYERFPKVSISVIFPKVKGICGCGCGRKLEGRKTRWFELDCQYFAVVVFSIINGRPDTIGAYLDKYYGWNCCKCGSTKDLKIDHIIPVKHGGGGSWLSNYQLLCHSCHVQKTNDDFGWKNNSREKALKESQLSMQLT